MPLIFRPAELRDAKQTVALIYSSAPAVFDYAFERAGVSAKDFLHQAFKDDQGLFGYQRHWVGEIDGRVVACGTGYSGELNRRNTLTMLRQVLLCYGPVSFAPVMRHYWQIEQIIQPPPLKTYYLAHLAVDKAMRGQGIGSRLIEHLLKLGTAAGFSIAALDVAVTNARAQALYEHLGFKVAEERHSDLAHVASHRFMTRPLSVER